MISTFSHFYFFLGQLLRLWWKNYCEALEMPHSYAPLITNERHRCLNCRTDFHGRFCPVCGQSASTARFQWKSTGYILLQLFGWGERSIPRTLWHLLYRPGYMISDYLAGRRIPYFPPIKLLFILATSVVLLTAITPEKQEATPSVISVSITPVEADYIKQAASKGEADFIKILDSLQYIATTYAEWARSHKALELLLIHSVLALISWRIFRKPQRNAYLTLPEHFYIQVYIACQLLFLRLLYSLFTFSHIALEKTYGLPTTLVLLILFYDYRQLFGGSWRYTLWHFFLFLFLLFLFPLIVGFIIGLSIGFWTL